MNLRIKEYRIVEHPYYLGWVIVGTGKGMSLAQRSDRSRRPSNSPETQ